MISGTVATLASNVSNAAGSPNARLTSDLATDRDRLTPGTLYYSIAWAYTGKDRSVDSNLTYHGYQITIWIHYRLTDATNERAYTELTPYLAETLLRALGDPAFWKAGGAMVGTNPDVYDFQRTDDALVLTAPTREGNIISFSAVAKLLLNV